MVNVSKAAIFTKFLGINRKFNDIQVGMDVIMNLEDIELMHPSTLEGLYHFKNDYENNGGRAHIEGLNNLRSLSDLNLAKLKIN